MTEPVVVDFPLSGISVAKRPPGHHPLALDLMSLNGPTGSVCSASRLRWALGGIPVERFHGWGQPIYGPGSGSVVASVDGKADRASTGAFSTVAVWAYATFFYRAKVSASGVPDIQPNVGNYVMVDTGPGQIVFYAHLRDGSIQVALGDKVRQGSVLARMGNSGNTTAPHLHIHVLDQIQDLMTAELVPFVFSEYELWDQGGWLRKALSLPTPGQVLRSLPRS